jgi:hypothetical protein
LAALQSLVSSAGWAKLAELAERDIETRNEILSEPIESIPQMLKQEFVKGEVRGIQSFLLYPQYAMQNLEEYLETLTQREEDGDE